jgi:hypothetical protein
VLCHAPKDCTLISFEIKVCFFQGKNAICYFMPINSTFYKKNNTR